MPFHKLIGVFALVPALVITFSLTAQDPAGSSADEDLLKSAGIDRDPAGLAAYLRKSILTDKDLQQFRKLVEELGSPQFSVREEAEKKLMSAGKPAVPFLRDAEKSDDPEMATRAKRCLTEIERGQATTHAAAAVRLLVRRQTPDTLPLLLDYFGFAPEEWVEEEVLQGIITLGLRGGKADPVLLTSLKDARPGRRAAAACVLGRSGLIEHRGAVRELLADPDARVRRCVAHGLLGYRYPRSNPVAFPDDDKNLKAAGMGAEPKSLVGFLRRRMMPEAELQKEINDLIRQLDGDKFQDREDASRRLIESGNRRLVESNKSVLNLLEEAKQGAGLEMTKRLQHCIDEIGKNPTGLSIAAVRTLGRLNSPEALPVLMEYLPFGEDASVREEVVNSLCLQSVREPRVDPALTAAVKDKLPMRRAAAAQVLGLTGTLEQADMLRALLKDKDAEVRFRAAQGLMAVRDKSAVPSMIGLLGDGHRDLALQVESMLQEIASGSGPTLLPDNPENGRKSQQAWQTWWTEHGAKVEMPGPEMGHRHVGLTFVVEIVTQKGGRTGQVGEYAATGQARWQITNIKGLVDAELLRGGRILIAEGNPPRVFEQSRPTSPTDKGSILWEKAIVGTRPIFCQRLVNGNTFVVGSRTVMEYTPQQVELYNLDVYSLTNRNLRTARKLANGNILIVNTGNTMVELDTGGNRVHSFTVPGLSAVEGLPGGRYLVTTASAVQERDRTGKVLWEFKETNISCATRLQNGNTLVGFTRPATGKGKDKTEPVSVVVEVNRQSKTVGGEMRTTGMPIRVDRR